MLSKLFRHTIKCSRASPSIFYPFLFVLLLGVTASVKVFASISAGGYHTCGVTNDGSVSCWGSDSDGQASPPGGTFIQVSVGHAHTCGLRTNGSIACWGASENNKTTSPSGIFTQISAAPFHTCGVKTDGNVVCWGYNYNDLFDLLTPPNETFMQVSAGNFYTCGVKTDRSVACWGNNSSGQATPPNGTFTQVSSGTGGSYSSGEPHSCGVKTNSSVVCWGYNSSGQANPPNGNFTHVSVGDSHSCGVKIDGSVVCWGDSEYGKSIPPNRTFTQVSVGESHSCGIKSNGSVECWGNDYNGQSTPPTNTFANNSFAVPVTEEPIRTFTGHTYNVYSVAFSPDGRYVLSGSGDDTFKLWNVNNGEEIRSFRSHTGGVSSVAFSPNGQYVLSGSPDTMLKLSDVNKGTEIHAFIGHTDTVVSVTFSPDGQYALSSSWDDTLKLWDVDSGSEIRSFRGHTDGVLSVVFSPNGRYALSSSWDKTLKLWDVKNGAEIRSFRGHTNSVPSVAFSPNGQYALSGSWDKTLKLWEVNSGTEIRSFSGHTNQVSSVAFSPDGRYALSGSYDYTLKLWEVDSGVEIRSFNGHTNTVRSVAFSPDGRYALSGSSDKTLKLWNTGLSSSPPPANIPPTANFTASPSSGDAPLEVILNANGSNDSDGTVTGYNWTSSDNQTLSGINPTIAFTQHGTYTINLVVTDNNGATSTKAQKNITVFNKKEEPPPSDGINTLILTNRIKLAQLYGSTKTDRLMSKLNELADHHDVQGLVIYVEDDSTVANAYAIRGNNYENANKANVVVVSIKQIIRRHWDTLGNQLKNIILIGDDRAIPFYRLKDGIDPNLYYPDPPDVWILTDDFYSDRNPSECPTCANPLVFIPDIAGGRLIETPTQITGMIEAFLANSNLNIGNAAITGYDFLQDSALSYCNTLQRLDITSDCSLIGEHWTRDNFVNQILNNYHDITSINGHADYDVFGTPDDKNIWASDFANSSTDFAGTLFYTVGCHSGLNVADKLDLPESLAIKQANYIANTGYGIGGLNGIELSEELMWNLTKELVKSQTTLGKALLNAKQQYFADNPNFGPFDEKIVAESTLYGLPMYQVTSSATAKLSPAITAIKTQTTEEQGLQKAGYSYTWATATPIATTSGKKFYSLNGTMTSSGEGKPILPKLSYNVTQTQKALHGVVFKGGNYNTVNVTPPIQRFKTTTGHITPERTFNAPGWYPSIFFTPNTVPLDTEAKETLVATAGQYNPNLRTGQQRIFSNMDFDVFHHANTNDWTKPTVYLMENRLNANIATVTIATSDASDIKEVVLAYTDGNGTWNSINLTGSDVTWTGSFAANANTEFFIQAIDKAGNVAVNDNEGKYFKVGQTPPTTTARLTARLINISARAPIQGGAFDVIAGFIISGTGTQKVIIRGWGLESGVNPKLTLQKYPSGEFVATNDNWQTDLRVNEIPAHFVLPNPTDAGLLLDLPVGAYTALLSSVGTPGLGLIGVDEVEQSHTAKLINLSTRAPIQGGANDVIAGLIITGTGTKKVMLRGFALEAGVNPKLTLQKYPSGEFVASNDDWQIDSRFSEIPEHLKLPNPTDAGLLLDLPVGAYTVILSSVGTKGLGLVGVDAID